MIVWGTAATTSITLVDPRTYVILTGAEPLDRFQNRRDDPSEIGISVFFAFTALGTSSEPKKYRRCCRPLFLILFSNSVKHEAEKAAD